VLLKTERTHFSKRPCVAYDSRQRQATEKTNFLSQFFERQFKLGFGLTETEIKKMVTQFLDLIPMEFIWRCVSVHPKYASKFR